MIEKGIMLILLAIFVFMPMAIYFAEITNIKDIKKTLRTLNKTLPDSKKRTDKQLDEFIIKRPPNYLQSFSIGLNTIIKQPVLMLAYILLGEGIILILNYVIFY